MKDVDTGKRRGSIVTAVRRNPSMAVAITALVFAMVGTATATQVIDNGASSAKKKKAKAGPRGPAGPAGPAGAAGAPGAPGAPGSALGFVTVTGAGDVVPAESSAGITDAMVSLENGNTAFCFNGLPFTPRMTTGVTDLNFAVSTFVQTTGANQNGGCAGAEQASATQVISTTGAVSAAPIRMHIAFY